MVLISKIFYVISDVDIYLDNKVTRFYFKSIGTGTLVALNERICYRCMCMLLQYKDYIHLKKSRFDIHVNLNKSAKPILFLLFVDVFFLFKKIISALSQTFT